MKKMGKSLASLLAVLTLTTGAVSMVSCENVDLSQIIGDGLNITVTPNGGNNSESMGNNTTSESAKDSTESAGNNVTSEKDSVTSESASESVGENESVKELPEGVILHDGFYYKVYNQGTEDEYYDLVGLEKQLDKLTLPVMYNDTSVEFAYIMNEGFIETKGQSFVEAWNSVWDEAEHITMDFCSEFVESKIPEEIYIHCGGNTVILLGGENTNIIMGGDENGYCAVGFYGCNNMRVFYEGTIIDSILIISYELNNNMELVIKSFNAGESEEQRFENVYYYSETQPQTQGNYWHYVDGEPTVW